MLAPRSRRSVARVVTPRRAWQSHTLWVMLLRLAGELLIFCALGLATGCGSTPTTSAAAPGFTFAKLRLPTTDMEGQPLPIGRLATVYFFAGPECPILRAYAPEVGRFVPRDADRGIAWIMVFPEFDISADLVKNFERDYALPIPAIIDSKQEIACMMGAATIPSVVVIDAAGTVLYKGRIDNRYQSLGVSYGPPTKRDLAEVLDAIALANPIAPYATPAIGCVLPPCLK